MNSSRNHLKNFVVADDFGGAQPVSIDAFLPTGRTLDNSIYQFNLNGANVYWRDGNSTDNNQRQVNVIESLSWNLRSHQFKFGADYRRVFPILALVEYVRTTIFAGGTGAISGISTSDVVQNSGPARYPIFNNYSAYAQDTWKASGLVPTSTSGTRSTSRPPTRCALGACPALPERSRAGGRRTQFSGRARPIR